MRGVLDVFFSLTFMISRGQQQYLIVYLTFPPNTKQAVAKSSGALNDSQSVLVLIISDTEGIFKYLKTFVVANITF